MPRGRPPKDSVNKPKGRMTAYAFFVQTCRGEHKKNHPDENVQFAEFSRQCADRWGTMSPKEKQKFRDMADLDKTRYDTEMESHTPTGRARRSRRSRGRRTKDPNKPKRALSAFFYYANVERPSVRSSNPDFSVGEVAKELGRQWNELPETEKSPYERMAEEDRARYDREMKDYKSGESPAKKKKANGHSAVVPEEDDDEEMNDDEDDDDEDE